MLGWEVGLRVVGRLRKVCGHASLLMLLLLLRLECLRHEAGVQSVEAHQDLWPHRRSRG